MIVTLPGALCVAAYLVMFGVFIWARGLRNSFAVKPDDTHPPRVAMVAEPLSPDRTDALRMALATHRRGGAIVGIDPARDDGGVTIMDVTDAGDIEPRFEVSHTEAREFVVMHAGDEEAARARYPSLMRELERKREKPMSWLDALLVMACCVIIVGAIVLLVPR